jgi:hypothetical protein
MAFNLILITLVLFQNTFAFIKFDQGKDYAFEIKWQKELISQLAKNPVKQSFEGHMLVRKLTDDEFFIQFKNMVVHNMNFVEDDFQRKLQDPFKIILVGHKINGILTTNDYYERVLKRKYEVMREFFTDYTHISELVNRQIEEGEKVSLEMPFGSCNCSTNFTHAESEIEIFTEAKITDCTPTKNYFGRKMSYIRAFTDATKNMITLKINSSDNKIQQIKIFTHEKIEFKNLAHKSETTSNLEFKFVGMEDTVQNIPLNGKLVSQDELERLRFAPIM